MYIQNALLYAHLYCRLCLYRKTVYLRVYCIKEIRILSHHHIFPSVCSDYFYDLISWFLTVAMSCPYSHLTHSIILLLALSSNFIFFISSFLHVSFLSLVQLFLFWLHLVCCMTLLLFYLTPFIFIFTFFILIFTFVFLPIIFITFVIFFYLTSSCTQPTHASFFSIPTPCTTTHLLTLLSTHTHPLTLTHTLFTLLLF